MMHFHYHCHHTNKCWCGYCFNCGQYVFYQQYQQPFYWYVNLPYQNSGGSLTKYVNAVAGQQQAVCNHQH